MSDIVPTGQSRIRNTARAMREDPAEALLALAVIMGPGRQDDFILGQEAAGQRELVNSDRLPVDSHGSDEAFIAAGFTFGQPDPGDPIFRAATLPAGWTRRGTDHSMWSEIVDPLGRKRVGIFYKAAFYDRSASMYLESPTSYLRSVLYGTTELVLDDEWLTPAVARETLVAIAEQYDGDAAEADTYGAKDPGNDYWPGRAAEHRTRAANARALADSIAGGAQ